MAFMGPFKQLAVMHDAVGEIKPCVLDQRCGQGVDEGTDGGELYFIADGFAGGFAFG